MAARSFVSEEDAVDITLENSGAGGGFQVESDVELPCTRLIGTSSSMKDRPFEPNDGVASHGLPGRFALDVGMAALGFGGVSSTSLIPGGVFPFSSIWIMSMKFPGCGGSTKDSSLARFGGRCVCNAEK